MDVKNRKEKNRAVNVWKYIVYTIGLFIIIGFSFKIGEITASAKRITCEESLKTFYSNSWAVYTTVFGIFGVVMGIVFPLYQSRQQDKMYKDEIEKIKEKIKELTDKKNDIKNEIKDNMVNVEISKIKNEYIEKDTDKEKQNTLYKLNAFTGNVNYKMAQDILFFLYDISYLLNKGEAKTSSEIIHVTKIIAFHNDFTESEKEKIFNQAVSVGYGFVYDTCLKTSPVDINSRTWKGLQLLKELYVESQKRNYKNIIKEIKDQYSYLLKELKKRKQSNTTNKTTNKTEYGEAISLLTYLISDLDNGERGVSFCNRPDLDVLLERPE